MIKTRTAFVFAVADLAATSKLVSTMFESVSHPTKITIRKEQRKSMHTNAVHCSSSDNRLMMTDTLDLIKEQNKTQA